MKKLFAITFSLLLTLQLVGCGGTSSAEQKPPLTEDEIAQMYTDPDTFKGRQVTLVGQLLGEPEKDDSGIYFQMYGDPVNYERNTIVAYLNSESSFSGDDYVKVIGTVKGVFEGENMMGGKITAPKIVADSVEQISYIDAVSPTKKSVEVNSTQSQHGYDVTLQKIEFANSETRVYLTVANNGAANFSLYEFNAKLVQSGRQYTVQSNYDADYPQIQSDLMPGATTEGIFTFPTLEQSSFTIVFEGSSNNWRETITPYTFEVNIS